MAEQLNATERATDYYGADLVTIYVARRNKILAKLQALSEADARGPFDAGAQTLARRRDRINANAPVQQPPSSTRKRAEGTTPRGVRELWQLAADNNERPPAKDRSLFDHYLWRFEREVGPNLDYGHRLCGEAEHDHRARTRGPVALEDTIDRDRRILSAYQGWSPAYVVAHERGVDELHVMRLRKGAGLDVHTGLDPLKDDAPDDPLLDLSLGTVELAKEFLRIFLDTGPQPATVVFEYADRAHISESTLRRAQKALGIKPVQNGGAWYWRLPVEVARAV